MKPLSRKVLLIGIVAIPIAIVSMLIQDSRFEVTQIEAKKTPTFDEQVDDNAKGMVNQGRQIFRFDTFGDQDFWGGQLQLHKAIAGEANGGVGPGLSPVAALGLGLKVDIDAFPMKLQNELRHGKKVNLCFRHLITGSLALVSLVLT